MSKKINSGYIMLAAIIIAGFFLRILWLGHESLWGDEFYSYYVSSSGLGDIVRYISSDYHPPLYYIILNGWINLFGSSEFYLRLLSVIAGCLSIWAIYVFMRKFSNSRTGLTAAALLAFSPLAINLDREARMYSLFLLLTIMSMMYFLMNIKEYNRKNSVLYILFTSLLLYIHGFSFIVLFLQFSYLIIDLIHHSGDISKAERRWISHSEQSEMPRRSRDQRSSTRKLCRKRASWIPRKLGMTSIIDSWDSSQPGMNIKESNLPRWHKLQHWAINAGISLMLFLPWMIIFARQVGNMNKYFWVNSRDVLFLGRFIIEFSGTITAAIVFICLIGILIYYYNRKEYNGGQYDLYRLIMIWLSFPVLIISLATFLYKPFFNIKYISFSLPAFYMAASLALDKIKISILKLSALCLVLFMSFEAIVSNLKEDRNEKWREAASYISHNIDTNDCIVLNSPGVYKFNPLTYYYRNKSTKFYLIDKPGIPEYQDSLNQLLNKYQRIWYIKTDHDYNSRQMLQLLKSDARLINVQALTNTESRYFFRNRFQDREQFFLYSTYPRDKIIIYEFSRNKSNE